MSSRKRILTAIGELREKLENLLTEQEAQRQDKLEDMKYIEEMVFECRSIKHDVTKLLVEERAMTTGPVIRSELVDNLYVEVLNNSYMPHNVRITLYDLEQYPKQHIEHRIVTVLSEHAVSEHFEIGSQGLDLQRFEVQVEPLNDNAGGIFIYIAGTQGAKYRLIQSNVFRHEQLVPIRDK